MSRTEQDLVGSMAVDADAYYGIHALRAAENFSITGRRLPGEMIVSMASIKKACARANTLAGVLPEKLASAIESACDEVNEASCTTSSSSIPFRAARVRPPI